MSVNSMLGPRARAASVKRKGRHDSQMCNEGIDLTDGGQAVVVQTIGDVVGVPLRLGAMVGDDDVVVMRIDGTGIMEEFTPMIVGAARYV